MADPFEVRVRFSAQLQNLNASVTSARKAAVYALKYRDLDEDLHSCILEQLEKVSFFAFFAFLLFASCSVSVSVCDLALSVSLSLSLCQRG